MSTPDNDRISSKLLTYPNVITLGDITEFPVFEDIVANEVCDYMEASHRDAWLGRHAIKDLIRPPKFNGTIKDIELSAIEEPYDRLLDAYERGRKILGRGHGYERWNAEEMRETTRAYALSASAYSSGKGKIGEIQTEIWYMLSPRRNTAGRYFSSSGYGSSAVKRVLTVPVIEKEKFIKADEDAKRIGLQVLRDAMANPLIGGLPRT